MDFKTTVKVEIYAQVTRTGRIPSVEALSDVMDGHPSAIREALGALADQHLLILAHDSGEIVQAPPFAAAPTPFLVEARGQPYFANCAWDALGIPVALAAPALVTTSCADCGDPITIRVELNGPEATECWTHFAVPAAEWWDDITFT